MNSTLAPPEEVIRALPQPEWDGPRCVQCQAPNPGRAMQVCACCGWYANLGIYVEVDPAEAEQLRTGGVTQTARQSFWRVWGGLIPWWGWVLIGTQFAIFAASIAARLLLQIDGTMYVWWGSSQLIAALLVGVVSHFVGFVVASASEVDMGIADVLVKPFKIWAKHIERLPEKLMLVNLGLSSVTAALCAALIVGGIPWYVLLDWKFKQPPKQNLMGAIVAHAQKVEGDKKPLEEAVGDFAGSAGGLADGKPNDAKQTPRQRCDCLIVGFTPNDDGTIKNFLLAAESGGKLIYVGRVVPTLDNSELLALHKRLDEARTSRPFVSTTRTATWVAPRFTCRVTFAKQSESGRFTEIEWEELLGELKVPW